MRAIYTKYLPATDRRGARIKAYTCDSRESLTVAFNYDSSVLIQHARAANAFIRTYMPQCVDMALTYGDAPNGYVFTFAASKVGGRGTWILNNGDAA